MNATISPRTARVLAVGLGTVYGGLALGYAYGPWISNLTSNVVTCAVGVAAVVCAVIGGAVYQRDPKARPRAAFQFAARAACRVSFGFFAFALFLLSYAGEHASAATYNALSAAAGVGVEFGLLAGHGVSEIPAHADRASSSFDSLVSGTGCDVTGCGSSV